MDFFDTRITDRAKELVVKCLGSERLSEGALVAEFEAQLDWQMGYKRGVAVNSCTSALHLALTLAGVGQGNDVILPAQTFVSTGHAILYRGANPVFADIGRDGNINPQLVINRINNRTRAVICVSWGGNPCELLALQEICEEHGLTLIQDNAQAFGATYLEKPLSEYGDFSCYSFQAIKHLTSGDGGLLTCKNEQDYQRAKKLRWFGIDRKHDSPDETGERVYNLREIGYKYHMNDYSAALGLGNLQGVNERLDRIKSIAKFYDHNIKYGVVHKVGSSHWLYDCLVESRTDFIRMMKSRDIPVSVVHVGIDRNDIFGGRQDLPVQREWDASHICLPIHSRITDEAALNVVKAVNGGW